MELTGFEPRDPLVDRFGVRDAANEYLVKMSFQGFLTRVSDPSELAKKLSGAFRDETNHVDKIDEPFKGSVLEELTDEVRTPLRICLLPCRRTLQETSPLR